MRRGVGKPADIMSVVAIFFSHISLFEVVRRGISVRDASFFAMHTDRQTDTRAYASR